jgi:glycosyltransferase involved in cell wall biosynthesis
MEQVLEPWRRRLGVRNRSGLKSLVGWAVDGLLHRHDHLAYQYSSGIIVSSSLDKDYLVIEQKVPIERVACIAQAPATPFVEKSVLPMEARRLRRILHVGGFAYWKGVHAVAAAVNRLLLIDDDFSMTWVCRMSEHDKVRALLEPYALKKVNLLGWVTQEELLAIYDSHGIFLVPSLFDGFGKVFLEAMARGMCVIGTPTGGMRDIIRTEENGFLVGFHDPEGIVTVIRRLSRSPELASAISAQAATDARGYSWDRVGRETADFYQRLFELGQRVFHRVN